MDIYQIRNKITNKSYVGKSANYIKRFESHKKGAIQKVNRRLYDSINHHGIDNFELILLERCSKEESNDRERYWILTLNSITPNGYNMTKGGDGGNTLEFWLEENKKLLYQQQGNSRRYPRNAQWRASLSKAAKLRESEKTEEEKKKISNQISDTLKRRYKNGEIKAIAPPKRYGRDHPGYIDVDVDIVILRIKECKTQHQISQELLVPVTAIRARLKEKLGKTFLELRREYGIIGKLSKPRLD
jgi:group I intron endonuclease